MSKPKIAKAAAPDTTKRAGRSAPDGAGQSRAAVPGRECLEAMQRGVSSWHLRGAVTVQLVLPGLAGCAPSSMQGLFGRLMGAIYGAHHQLLTELRPRAGSSWEAVELMEAVLICNWIAEGDVKESEGTWQFHQLEDGAGDVELNREVLLLHLAGVLHRNARLIAEFVLPKIGDPCSAGYLAQGLVLAEQILDVASEHTLIPAGQGTIANPTELQRLAWHWTERAREHMAQKLIVPEREKLSKAQARVGLVA